jgi:putative peptidoglycan lipid II flippase
MQKNFENNQNKSKTAIGKIAISLSVIAVLTKIFGFTEKLIVAHFFGTDAQADVYFASMGIILSVVFLVKELIYPSVLPVFAQSLKTSFAVSSALFKRIFLWMLTILAILAFVMVLFSGAVTTILVPGFTEDKKMLTSSLLRYLAPSCLFLCLTTLTYAVLNCRRNFLKAALPEAVFKLLIAAGLVILAPIIGIYALAVVLTIASMAVFIVQFFFIPEGRVFFSNNLSDSDNEFKKALTLMGPLVVGVVFSHISGLIDNMFASTLPTGQLSFLGYSKKLIDSILLIGPVALVTVVYSQLSHLNAEGRVQEFKCLFIRALRLIFFASLRAAIVLIMLRASVVAVLFERGRFTAQSTLGTSQALFIYSIGLVAFSLEALVVFTFYALSNTKVPVRVGILCVLLNILLTISLIGFFGFAAIAWAFVISKTIKVFVLLFIINRKFRFIYEDKFITFIVKATAASSISAFCLYFCQGIMHSYGSFVQTVIFNLAIPAAVFGFIFACCCWLLGIEEINYLTAILLRKKSLKLQLTGNKI